MDEKASIQDDIDFLRKESHGEAEKRIKDLMNSDHDTSAELYLAVTFRINDPYKRVLTYRNTLWEEREKLRERIYQVKDPHDKKDLMCSFREMNNEYLLVNKVLDDYRALNAMAIRHFGILRQESDKDNGKYISYEKDTIGNLKAIGDFPIGSPEWHEARSNGIGGSDVAKIRKIDSKYGEKDYREIVKDKLGITSVDDSHKDDIYTAPGRGNAWEDAILLKYIDKNPDKKVAHCKMSWAGEGEYSYRHANFDGLLLDDNGDPEGIVEIKTGNHNKKWGDPKQGIHGIPKNYQQQIIWYAYLAQLKYGVIVAVLDDYDYREYYFSMDDPYIQKECQNILKDTEDFWKMLTMIKTGKELFDKYSNSEKVIRHGFAKSSSMVDYARFLSTYNQKEYDNNYINIVNSFKELGKFKSQTSAEEIQNIMLNLCADTDPSSLGKPLIGIDIETNHADSKTGYIIEVAVVELLKDGTTKVLFQSLFDVPDKVKGTLGSGDSSIHHITNDMLLGKKTFVEDKESQRIILDYLKSGVMVAHNASFEKKFLSMNLDGFDEACDNGEITILDTMYVTRYLIVESPDDTLHSFSEINGIPYIGAHSATADTEMMLKALYRTMQSIHDNKKFIQRSVTNDDIKKSLDKADKAIKTR